MNRKLNLPIYLGVFVCLGALLALVTLSRYHDRQLDKVK